ncbi:hypothetical protein [Alkalicoccobacillus porphyridii]|nr:hypothetical protein [Alkalicoccobacillus porphyridii]
MNRIRELAAVSKVTIFSGMTHTVQFLFHTQRNRITFNFARIKETTS